MWKYGDHTVQNINNLPKGCTAIVYQITNSTTGQWYVGKKNLYKKDKSESDWKTYKSSNKEVKEWFKTNPNSVEKRILTVCFTKLGATYFEMKALACMAALEDINCVNANILGKFYKKAVVAEMNEFMKSVGPPKKVQVPKQQKIVSSEDLPKLDIPPLNLEG